MLVGTLTALVAALAFLCFVLFKKLSTQKEYVRRLMDDDYRVTAFIACLFISRADYEEQRTGFMDQIDLTLDPKNDNVVYMVRKQAIKFSKYYDNPRGIDVFLQRYLGGGSRR